jgi:hypothetical protein
MVSKYLTRGRGHYGGWSFVPTEHSDRRVSETLKSAALPTRGTTVGKRPVAGPAATPARNYSSATSAAFSSSDASAMMPCRCLLFLFKDCLSVTASVCLSLTCN